MRIGGTTRDSLMTLIPVAVAVVAVLYLLGGPDEAVRAMERGAGDAWLVVGNWFRR